jgi:peptide/nickel transport system substrate-binding protein
MAAAGLAAASCAQPTPQVIEKEVPVEKVVKETVVVEKKVRVEKVVTPTPVTSKYTEAPMLAGKVQQGELPPVDERLPEEPRVIEPHEEIGQYGGTWHRLATSAGDTKLDSKMTYEYMLRYNKDGSAIVPNVAKAWEVSPDGKEFTFELRPGMKWSDGEPFTAADVVYLYEDEWLDEDLSDVPGYYRVGGEPLQISKVDDYTVKISFAEPYGLFLSILPGLRGGDFTMRPKHYLSKFHEKYVDKAELNAMMNEEGFEFWYQLYGSKDDPRTNVDLPVILAWQLTVPAPKQPIVAERNPYYWKVDPEGNQLPYIDRIEWMLVEGKDQINLRAVQGEIDMQLRHITFDNYPLYQENKEKGDYRVLDWPRGEITDTVIAINLTNQDPVLREIVQDKRFRWALSVGINRDEIIEGVYLGVTEPNQVSPLPSSKHYWEPQAKNLIEYDPEQGNQWLNEIGLTERDGEGYRLRPDGERLSLVYEYAPVFGAWRSIGEILVEQWKALGVELVLKEEARQLFYERKSANEQDIGIWTGSGEFNPLIEPRWFVPLGDESVHAIQYAAWWNSDGTEGIEPTGDILEVLELWEEIKVTVDEDKQADLFRQILEYNKENLWVIGICTSPPQPVIVKNNFRNVPPDGLYDSQVRAPGSTATEQYYIRS